MLNEPVANIHEALEVYLGSSLVSDFNLLGRTNTLVAQADAQFRETAKDIARLRTRFDECAMVSFGAVANFEDAIGPLRQ